MHVDTSSVARRRSMKLVHIVSWLSLMSACAAAQDSPADVRKIDTTAIDAYLQKTMENEHVPGVSVAVVKAGKLAFAKGYGLADVELDSPATADTVYEMLSVSKQF